MSAIGIVAFSQFLLNFLSSLLGVCLFVCFSYFGFWGFNTIGFRLLLSELKLDSCSLFCCLFVFGCLLVCSRQEDMSNENKGGGILWQGRI